MDVWLNNLFLRWERLGPVYIKKKIGYRKKRKFKYQKRRNKNCGTAIHKPAEF